MKWTTVVQVSLGRVLLPLALLAAAVLRQNLLSLTYFILLLVSPLIRRNTRAFKGAFRGYLITVLVYSLLVVLSQIIFQSYLGLYAAIHHQHYGDVLGTGDDCGLVDTLQWIGFQRVDAPSSEIYHSVRLLLPDGIMLLVSVITFLAFKYIKRPEAVPEVRQTPSAAGGKAGVIKKFITYFGELIIIVLLGASSAMIPSLTSAFYFFIFVGVLIYWSLNLKFDAKRYGVLKVVLFAYLILHMLLLYFCQLKFLQTWLDDEDKQYYSRLIGMTPLIVTTCSKPWSIKMEDHSWPYFANPITLFVTFAVISLDFAYHRSNTLLSNEQQHSYGAAGSSRPLTQPDRAAGDGNSIEAEDEIDGGNRVRKAWDTIYNLFMRNSYLLAFFAMMFWAVGYPSWTAFVFLILGCALWLFPNSRRASLLISPLLVFYAVGLTGLQYFCSINFGGIDYNTTLFFDAPSNYLISTVGLTGNNYPPIAIMLKLLFTACFCIVLKELRREHCLRGRNEQGLCMSPLTSSRNSDEEERMRSNESTSVDNVNLKLIGLRIKVWFSKYWIGAFYLLLLIMAIQEPYIYRLFYMVLFLYSAITFQLHFPFWRRSLKVFLLVVALYSIFAMLVIYILSFHEVLVDFQNATHMETDWLADLGFDPAVNYQDDYNGSLKLLWRLLVPAFLLITVMLQIHLFHKKFLELTDKVEAAMRMAEESNSQIVEESDYKGFVGDIVKLYYKLKPLAHKLFYSLCRIATIHTYKVIYIVAMFILTREASALGFVLLVILNFSLFFNPVSKFRKVCLLTAQFWVGIIILARMLFQLRTVPKDLLMTNCTTTNNGSVVPANDTNFEGVQDDAAWLGLRTLPHDTGIFKNSLSYYIGGYVVVLVGLTMLAMFRIHDYYRCKVVNLPVGITFPTIKWQELDSSFTNLLGYLINYGFIKFGLEICFMVSAIVISYRQDAIGALYALLLGILLMLTMCRRRFVRNIWFIYLVTLGLLLPAQYLSALGLPPTLCHDYPWVTLQMRDTFRLWLYLPDYTNPPHVQSLMADCVQFLFVALQWQVFCMESSAENATMKAAGDNEELGCLPPAHFKDMHDFIDNKRNVVDVLKSGIFIYWFWLCIAILFITGTMNINFYCLGYLVSSFYFFWHGLDFTIKGRKSIMRMWNGVLYYNFVVILVKTWLQILGCVFLEDILKRASDVENAHASQCYAPELFSIRCLNKQFVDSNEVEVCGVSEKEAGLTWDIVCFIMLLVQRRVFMSSYFLVVVCEEKSQAVLSSRGAELINILSSRRIAKQRKDEQKELAQINKKLEKIRLRTARLAGGVSREDWTHFDVIRSGDEAMFDDASDDETQTIGDDSDITDPDFPIEDASREKAKPMQMLVRAIDTGLESSLKRNAEGDNQPRVDVNAGNSAAGSSTAGPSKAGPSKAGPSGAEDGDAGDGEIEASTEAEEAADPLARVEEQVKTADAWLKVFIVTCVKWAINKLNEISYDYRTVARLIDEEQKQVKTEEKERMMTAEDVCSRQLEDASPTEVQLQVEEQEWQDALEQRSLIYRLLNALYLAMIAHTEFICYFAMILCQICNGTLLSLPLPIIAVLWGMLSLPRPAKTFWIAVLSYVMFIVVLKYVFQFSLWPWSDEVIKNWYDPRLLFGIQGALSLCVGGLTEDCTNEKAEGHPYYATYELLILLSVFVHRSVLKRYGLWRNEFEQEDDFNRAAIADVQYQNTLVPSSSSAADNLALNADGDQDEEQLQSSSSNKSSRGISSGCSTISTWYDNLMSGKLFSKGDYYALMVFCDFINFLISVFAFSSFGPPQEGNVQVYLSQNRIPVPFLIILLVQFVFIVIDRALYLKKAVRGKLVFHVLLVIVVHVWVCFVLPALTRRPFNDNVAAQLWYFIKCIYFGLSAWQIKSGYPTGVLGNFLTTKYGYVNLVLFKLFMICPFLLELRCVMDWMWTKTSMSLSTWFTMEDIFANIFVLKCFRQGEKEYPTVRATNRRALVKYGLGGVALVILIFIIWFPLVIFSFANTIYLANPPVQCQMTVSIGGFQDIFTVRSQPTGIGEVTLKEHQALQDAYSTNWEATGFLDNYGVDDIRTIRLNGESTAIWGITPPSANQLKKVLDGNDSLSVAVTLSFTRRSKEGLTAGTISTQYYHQLSSAERVAIRKQMRSNDSKTPVVLPSFLPRYLLLPATGEPSIVSSLHCQPCTNRELQSGMMPTHGLILQLEKSNGSEYWKIGERSHYTQEYNSSNLSSNESYSDLFFVTFNTRIVPNSVSFITGPGIVGLYIGMVFVISQFMRTLTSGSSQTLMFTELPYVDRVMKICKDLYFVRENGKLQLEEELFAKLVFLYRSPKMMIEFTKLKVS